MSLYFITGNEEKFKEIAAILPDVKQLDIDLQEIQHFDAHHVLDAKLKEAQQHQKGAFIVEDTSLYLDSLNGLPGPFIKWFLKTVKKEGLFQIAKKFENPSAEAKTVIGYINDKGKEHFFEGSIKGDIVAPRGDLGFGWDPIFQPDGHEKTFAEMSKEEKNDISMRRTAVNALKSFLESES